MEKKIRFGIHWIYRSLTIQCGFFEIRLYFKERHMSGRPRIINLNKMGSSGYLLEFFFLEILWGSTSAFFDKVSHTIEKKTIQ